ncbi:type 1 glutamine amidotransferase [Streptomyces sp. NPDC002784]
MPVLTVADEELDALGYLTECFEAHGLGEVRMCHRARSRPWPVPELLKGADLVVSLGSLSSVRDETTQEARAQEHRVYEAAIERGIPVLAICYGAQVLSQVLGAPSREAPSPEIGWVEVDSIDSVMLPTGPWLEWHEDLLVIPVGATLLARTSMAPQVYAHGRCLAVQFHPEVTPEELDRRVAMYRDALEQQGVDVEALTVQAHRQGERSRAMTRQLFDIFWSGIAAGQ